MTLLRNEIADAQPVCTEQSDVTCRCEDCRRPLTAEISVACGRGPVCRARSAVVA